MSISLKLEEKMLIKFDECNSILHEFMDNCDQVYNLISDTNWPIWFLINKTKLTSQNRIFKTLQELKQFSLHLYLDKKTLSQWQLELNSCRQNFSKSVASFTKRVESGYLELINA